MTAAAGRGDPVEELYARGFCVLEGVYDQRECRRAADLLEGYWLNSGRPPLSGQGFGIHPLLRKVPEMRPLFARSLLFDVIGEALGAQALLLRTGARISDRSSRCTLVGWHHHHHWDPKRLIHRTRIERVLCVAYPDGTGPDGRLALFPRGLNTPLRLHGPKDGCWEGEVALQLRPGSVAIFDSATWHAARRGHEAGRRRIFGGHFQASDLDQPHPDDLPTDQWSLSLLGGGAS